MFCLPNYLKSLNGVLPGITAKPLFTGSNPVAASSDYRYLAAKEGQKNDKKPNLVAHRLQVVALVRMLIGAFLC